MSISEAQKQAKKKYEAKAYDTLNLRVKKGERARIKAFAESRGQSINGFCKAAIYSAMGETEETES